MEAEGSKTLVIGLGNPILGDDGVGWQIAKSAQKSYKGDATFELSSSGGLGLMELMVGYQRVIIADAIVTPARNIGAIHSQSLDAIKSTAHSNSSHDASLQAALETGRTMGLQLPSKIWVVAVEMEPTYVFSESLSPAVAAAVPEAARVLATKLN